MAEPNEYRSHEASNRRSTQKCSAREGGVEARETASRHGPFLTRPVASPTARSSAVTTGDSSVFSFLADDKPCR